MVHKNKTPLSALLFGTVLFSIVAANANAATVNGSCEYRFSPERSKVVARVKGLPTGGAFTVQAGDSVSPVLVANANGEIQAQFDSNMNDILAGKIPISPETARTGSVTIKVRNAMASEIVNSTVACRTR